MGVLDLPPGLRGFVAGEELGQRRQGQQLQQATGILSLLHAKRQGEMEEQMMPLKLAQLQAAVDAARQTQEIRKGVLSSFQGPQTGAQGALAAEAAAGGAPGPTNEAAARIPAQAAAAGGGGIPPNIRLQLLSGDPGLKADAQAWLEQNKPIAAREGAPVINPATGQILFYAPKLETGMMPSYSGGQITGVNNIPNYVQSMAERERSTLGTRAGYEMVDAPILGPDGKSMGTRRMTKAQELQMQGGGGNPPPAAPIPPSPAGPVAPDPLAGRSPEEIAAIRQVQAAGSRPASVQVPPPAGASSIPRGGIPAGAVLGTPSATATAADTATATGRAKGGVDYENSILEGGRLARSNLTNLQILAPNLEKLPSGPLYPAMVSGASYFKQFGIDVGQISKDLGPAQASGAILNQLALKLRNPAGGEGMPGSLSDQDRVFLANSLPGLNKLPDGNKLLLGTLMELEQRKIDESAIVSRMQSAGKTSNQIREALNQFGDARPVGQSLRQRLMVK